MVDNPKRIAVSAIETPARLDRFYREGSLAVVADLLAAVVVWAIFG
jgi:hypothetical protein